MKKLFIILAALALSALAFAQEPTTMYIMKDNKVIYQSIVSEIDSIIDYEPEVIVPVTPTSDPGVIINGIRWATRNVDEFGTFAATPESSGKFYQWNRSIAWSATEPGADEAMPGWDTTMPAGTVWTVSNDPSPAGWRVPTFEEQQSLLDTDKVSNEWVNQNGVMGRKFIDLNTGASLFLPISGARYYDGGSLLYSIYSSRTYGIYWSSTPYRSDNAFYLYVGNDIADWHYSLYHSYGLSVRPVAK
jgi:uncharacterized protein (TIGR02145 family)